MSPTLGIERFCKRKHFPQSPRFFEKVKKLNFYRDFVNLAKNILSKVFQIIQLTETFDTKRFCQRRNFLQNSQYSKHNKKNFGSFLLFWRLRHLILNVFVRELIFQKSYVFDEGENINFLSRLYQFGGKRPKQFFSKF